MFLFLFLYFSFTEWRVCGGALTVPSTKLHENNLNFYTFSCYTQLVLLSTVDFWQNFSATYYTFVLVTLTPKL